MEYKSVVASVKEVQDRTVTGFTAVMGNIDDGADRILNGAFRKTLKESLPRVKHLWQHDASQPPIAVITEAKEVGLEDLPVEMVKAFPDATGALQVSRKYLDTPRGDEVLRAIIEGAIKEMSFGYDPVKYDFEEIEKDAYHGMIRNLREVRLWDTSDVNWGMNPATVASKALEAPELQHHKTDGAVDPEKVQAVMSLLMLGKVSVSPESARKSVYEHLAAHIKQFGTDPIDFDAVELAYRASTFQADSFKAGRVLSAANLERLKTALQTLQEILSAAEPQDDPGKVAALTATVLKRLAIAEHDPLLLS